MDDARYPVNTVKILRTESGMRRLREAAATLGLNESRVVELWMLAAIPRLAKLQTERGARSGLTITIDELASFADVPSI